MAHIIQFGDTGEEKVLSERETLGQSVINKVVKC